MKGALLTPKKCRRGRTESKRKKAFERYFRTRRMKSVKVVPAIKARPKKKNIRNTTTIVSDHQK